ncbi:MAG: enoyl-CoA hydratase-related protein, partial [Cyanobacteriota bacterium]
MSNKLVSLRIEDRVGILSLNNPPVNVLNKKLLDDLDEILSEIEKNDEIKVIVLTGEGNAFAAGADIKSMPEI